MANEGGSQFPSYFIDSENVPTFQHCSSEAANSQAESLTFFVNLCVFSLFFAKIIFHLVCTYDLFLTQEYPN